MGWVHAVFDIIINLVRCCLQVCDLSAVQSVNIRRDREGAQAWWGVLYNTCEISEASYRFLYVSSP